LDFDALCQFNAQCSSMYKKAEQVNMKYTEVDFEMLKKHFGYAWYSYRETESSRVNVTLFTETHSQRVKP